MSLVAVLVCSVLWRVIYIYTYSFFFFSILNVGHLSCDSVIFRAHVCNMWCKLSRPPRPSLQARHVGKLCFGSLGWAFAAPGVVWCLAHCFTICDIGRGISRYGLRDIRNTVHVSRLCWIIIMHMWIWATRSRLLQREQYILIYRRAYCFKEAAGCWGVLYTLLFACHSTSIAFHWRVQEACSILFFYVLWAAARVLPG